MKILGEIYDFVAGGSIAAPVGAALALLVAHFGSGLAPAVLAAAFFGILLLTFFASTLERAR
ncbi:MAG: hypothetical protein ABI231_05540 [Candidatus Tumulicola sp.]